METPDCPTKPLSLDEAVAHADEAAGDCGTACKREHKQLADWLRELKARRSAEYGDAAKLREALKLCVDEMCDRCRELAVARGNPLPCLSGCEPVRKAKAALAAPPRNCDVYSSDELKVIFKRELVSELPIANEHQKNLVTITAMGVINTLFAPATEKKGENNGR